MPSSPSSPSLAAPPRSSAPPPMIELQGVHVTLGSAAGPVKILRGIDLEVAAGSSVSVVGPSGSGKSTLLAVVGGIERPTAGAVRVDGQAFGELDEDRLAVFRGREIGILFQSFHLIPTMTALENVAVPLELAGCARRLWRGRGAARRGRALGARRALSRPALGRRAAAHGARPRAQQPPEAPAGRRADRQSRPGHRPRDRRALVPGPARARDDAALDHPRARARAALRAPARDGRRAAARAGSRAASGRRWRPTRSREGSGAGLAARPARAARRRQGLRRVPRLPDARRRRDRRGRRDQRRRDRGPAARCRGPARRRHPDRGQQSAAGRRRARRPGTAGCLALGCGPHQRDGPGQRRPARRGGAQGGRCRLSACTARWRSIRPR